MPAVATSSCLRGASARPDPPVPCPAPHSHMMNSELSKVLCALCLVPLRMCRRDVPCDDRIGCVGVSVLVATCACPVHDRAAA